MTALEDVRATAHLFGWGVNSYHDGDTLIRGEVYINVTYRKDGAIHSAEKRMFHSVEGVHPLLDVTYEHKKEAVLSWLSE